MKVKNLYKVVMLFHRQAIIRYFYAWSEKQAKMLAINKVADEHGVNGRVVACYFIEHPDAIQITVEMEVTEND